MADLPLTPFVLSGLQSQQLRSFCTSKSWTGTDLDIFARFLVDRDLINVQRLFRESVEDSGIEAARQETAAKVYGPTKIPVFNLLLQFTILKPQNRKDYVEIIRYLALDAKIPVDSMDLSGTTTFMWAISTKPYLDIEIANIMLEAGAKVNHRNRYGCTAAQDFCIVSDTSTEGKRKALAAVKYFVEKGGDLDIKDGDGVSARKILAMASASIAVLKPYAQVKSDGAPRCGKCNAKNHENGQDLLTCGRCKSAKYCSRECQTTDWKKHKTECAK